MLSEPANSPSIYAIPLSVREQEAEKVLLTHPYNYPPPYDSLDLDPPPPYCQVLHPLRNTSLYCQ